MSYPNISDLVKVNAAVNVMPYTSDVEKYGVPDFWARITDEGTGDCEDYALGKLNELLKLGWPISALRLACVYVETGEYHAVLVVVENNVAYVLDNRQSFPCSLSDLEVLGYRPDRVQKEGGSQSWVKWGSFDAV